MDSVESSIVGTAIQFSGTVVVTILCTILRRTIQRDYLYYWEIGWCSLSCALAALLAGFALPVIQPLTFPLYCFGEYTAGFMWIAGCRNLTSDYRLTPKDWYWAVPASLIAVVLPWSVSMLNGDFNAIMIVHSLLMACLFATAFAVLYASRNRSYGIGAGAGVMMAALFVLTVDFLQYAPLCGYSHLTGRSGVFPHLRYSSLYDLMLEMLLAFGMVMVVMEMLRRELEDANRELRSAGSRMKQLAQCDPLTGALNRHAFDALIRDTREEGMPFIGCVAILDIDNLKPINDTLGHHSGDRAIQMIAQTARTIIRNDDLVFRWGGDEFLILWIGPLKEAEARRRLERINAKLQETAELSGVNWPCEPSVSYGLATFANVNDVDDAIHRADVQMYAQKSSRRVERAVPVLAPSLPEIGPPLAPLVALGSRLN